MSENIYNQDLFLTYVNIPLEELPSRVFRGLGGNAKDRILEEIGTPVEMGNHR